MIDQLKDGTVRSVATHFRLGWDAIDGIKTRAVKRGLARRKQVAPKDIGIDEVAYKRGHSYYTIISDAEHNRVLHIEEGRKHIDVEQWFRSLTPKQIEQIRSVSMDMWKPYINAVKQSVPDAENKIAFDKFHVIRYLTKAVNTVRRQEQRAQIKEGIEDLKGSKYLWLRDSQKLSPSMQEELEKLKKNATKTSSAWAFKELASTLWSWNTKFVVGGYRPAIRAIWKDWIDDAKSSALKPIRSVGELVERHLYGIVNAITMRVSNGPAEGINSQIKRVKMMGCGYRNRESLKTAIYFKLGDLDLYPDNLKHFQLRRTTTPLTP